MIKRWFCIFILLFSSVNADVFTYRTTCDGESIDTRYQFSRTTDNIQLRVVTGEKLILITNDLSYHSQSMFYYDKSGVAAYSMTRSENRLLFKDILREKEYPVTVDDFVWYGSPGLLRGFVQTNKKEEKFCVAFINDVTGEYQLMKWLAVKEAVETINVGDKKLEALRVKVTFPDWRGMFWASYYWFRVQDGVLVKTKETRGPPGTSQTVMELTGEQ